jgi:hypothetical protein
MTTKITMSEADLQRAVIDAAHTFGWMAHHTRPAQYQSGRWATPIQGDPGFVDLVLVRDGVVLFVELKAEKGRIRPEQMRWIVELGGIVWRPEHWTSGEIVGTLR